MNQLAKQPKERVPSTTYWSWVRAYFWRNPLAMIILLVLERFKRKCLKSADLAGRSENWRAYREHVHEANAYERTQTMVVFTLLQL